MTSLAATCPTCGRPGTPIVYRDLDGPTDLVCSEGHQWRAAGRVGWAPYASPAAVDSGTRDTTIPTEPRDVSKDGRNWRIGTASDVAWLAGRTTQGLSVTTAIPPVFEAYGTFHRPEDVEFHAHERAVIDELVSCTSDQPWWLGFLDTGAHDVVFPHAARVSLYDDWSYVLVQAGPEQALAWRVGHMRGSDGALPDLFFPADRSWLVSALWDDTWADVGASLAVLTILRRNPLVNARLVGPDEDACPPGLMRD
ncbi:hypothetical protein OG992_04910 [Micromonospora sp. NBC_00362]|uniref:hypothetical protein n=1 Tax=Micromonospora sp. NBC_00362 TaxID=2975975 RepID=UPI0022541AB7|nr:hypothetical protein [Micromonospora sp. NBC_00362]MCX5116506.1 hypothetical protein [Micromonospora sp. NBC_00362]